jgi:hypothetical protein
MVGARDSGCGRACGGFRWRWNLGIAVSPDSHRHFLEERRGAYVRFLAALKEWEPLRDRDWRLRDSADEASLTVAQRDDMLQQWQQSRDLTAPFFRRLLEAEQEIILLGAETYPRHHDPSLH